MKNPLSYFAELRDPRVERTREHLLEEILLITIAAVLSGAESGMPDARQQGKVDHPLLGDRRQKCTQVEGRIDPVQLGCADEAVERCRSLAAGIGTHGIPGAVAMRSL